MKMFHIFTILCAFAIASPVLAEPLALTKEPIKIGWLYSFAPAPYAMNKGHKAAVMGVEEFNLEGGLKGRHVELVVRDDKGDPSSGLISVIDLVESKKVDLLAGISFAQVSKAIYEYAEHNKIPYFATFCSSDVCTKRDPGYTYSFEEPYDESARTLAQKAATYNIKKWAVVRNPDSWSVGISDPFIAEMKKLQPDVEFVTTISVPFGKAQGGAIAQSLISKGAEAVYVTLFNKSDLANYVRAINQRGLNSKIRHVHAYLPQEVGEFLGSETPEGWYVMGYPNRQLKTPENLAFIDKFEKKYGEEPGLIGALSYSATKFMLETLKKAETLNPDVVSETARSLSVSTPVGPMSIMPNSNAADFKHWYGYLTTKDGKFGMKDFVRGDGIK